MFICKHLKELIGGFSLTFGQSRVNYFHHTVFSHGDGVNHSPPMFCQQKERSSFCKM